MTDTVVQNNDGNKDDFMGVLVAENALQFGDFTLKSGRKSPYFFNLGKVISAKGMRVLGQCYARALMATDWQFDVVFGPAYKGIPIATATVLALEAHHRNTALAYNRKEVKDHGEGGILVGASVRGKRVVIVDDILTAGTAARQAVDVLRSEGAEVTGLMVALDRQERVGDGRSATEALAADEKVPVQSVVRFGDVINHVREQGDSEQLEALVAYRELYGC